MDSKIEAQFSAPIVVTGIGSIVAVANQPLDVLPWLKSPKMRKFMGKQDQLAVIAAGQAVQHAAVADTILRDRTGIYLCVGYIPFERADIESIARNSSRDGHFSMELFSTSGFSQVNPLLTFRCLPNMPIFHVSLNFGIQGPYFITYPGVGQLYLALEQAAYALQRGEIDLALVGAVADQNNFLVQHHFHRIRQTSDWNLCDAAAFLCLQKPAFATKAKMEWLSYEIHYDPPDPYHDYRPYHENFCDNGLSNLNRYLGASSLFVSLHKALGSGYAGELTHHVETMDGISASSRWRICNA